MSIPSEVVSKIMLFHSNIRFDKNELINFVADWNELKSLQENNWETGEWICKIDTLIEKPLIKRFYDRWIGEDLII